MMQDFEEYMYPEDIEKSETDPCYAGWFWSLVDGDHFRWPTFIAKCRLYDKMSQNETRS